MSEEKKKQALDFENKFNRKPSSEELEEFMEEE